MFKGSIPALVTPFKDGALDLDTLKKLVDWHIAEGTPRAGARSAPPAKARRSAMTSTSRWSTRWSRPPPAASR